MFVSATSPVVLCMYKFVLNLFYLLLYFFLAGQGCGSLIKRICASGWFVLPVGLYEWKVTTAQPVLSIMLKNVLRTCEAEIPKILKNIQPQPKN